MNNKSKTTTKDDTEKDADTLQTTNDGPNNNLEPDSSSYRWLFALVLPLQLVYISNQWSRSSIYYLVNFAADADAEKAMNVAIGFTEAQYGLLASLAFTALFAVASLAAGAAADKYDRKALTIIAAVGWAVATIGTAFSSTYTEVLSWRVLMGLFCAFSTPTAYTLIKQQVPKDRLSLATSIYGTGVAFGGALASLSILLDNQLGWQQALIIIGGIGLLSAALVGLVLPGDNKDDMKSKNENDDSEDDESSFIQDISEAVSTNRAKWIFLGSFLRFSSGLVSFIVAEGFMEI